MTDAEKARTDADVPAELALVWRGNLLRTEEFRLLAAELRAG